MPTVKRSQRKKIFIETVNWLLENEYYKNKAALSTALGITPGYFSNLYAGEHNVPVEHYERIVELAGGYRGKSEKNHFINETEHAYEVKTREQLLRIENELGRPVIPVYEIQEATGRIDFDNPKDFVIMPNDMFEGCTCAMYVRGDELAPEYNSGDMIGCKEIKDLSIIFFGKPHVVVTAEQTFIRVVRRSPEDGMLELHSTNEEKYPFLIVPVNKIETLLLIRRGFRPKFETM